MIAAMTADVGIVRIQDTRIFPSMDHWTCLQPKDASATAVTAPICERREEDERGAPVFLTIRSMA